MLVYLGLGSNLGDRAGNLAAAVASLAAVPGVRVRRLSRVWETEPVGGPAQGEYLNAVAEVETELPPASLLDAVLEVEHGLGRERAERWGPRILDIDLLLAGDRVVESGALVLPHPRLAERRFVLEPLAELVPDLRHPVAGRTIAQLLAGLPAAARAVRCRAVGAFPHSGPER
ncbi:MAG: 2-amino-4-hydroxy-6-hydroxymethyldihydropteridine diphosphokinase [Planctomycetes bacterium]|nr:2-amino-4-hydroxy-6-hydroxymethyldihydropteridine diphosphokinase [Planctomycetota bacterium]